MREFLEKSYTDEVAANQEECIKLALKALLEVVQSGAKNVELAVMRDKEPLKVSTYVLVGRLLSHCYPTVVLLSSNKVVCIDGD